MKKIVPSLLAILMVMGAAGHLFFQEIYLTLIPEVMFPDQLFSSWSGIAGGDRFVAPQVQIQSGLGFHDLDDGISPHSYMGPDPR